MIGRFRLEKDPSGVSQGLIFWPIILSKINNILTNNLASVVKSFADDT